MHTYISYSYNREHMVHMLGVNDLYDQIRMPHMVEESLRCLVLTRSGINKRGSSKYATVTFKKTSIDLEEVKTICKSLGYVTVKEIILNNKTVFSLLANNLTALLRTIEQVIRLSLYYNEGLPEVNITTDLPTLDRQEIYCCDYASFISTIQITNINEQSGLVFLQLDSADDPNLPTIILTCVNTRDKIKICLDCDELDRKIWVERAIAILQDMNIDFDTHILRKLVICDPERKYSKNNTKEDAEN